MFPLPIMLWRHPRPPFKFRRKIGDVRVPAFRADLRNGHGGVFQELFRKGKPQLAQILLERYPGVRFELTAEIIRRVARQLCRIFQMKTLQSVLSAAQLTGSFYTGGSALYKDERTGTYLLVLSQGDMSMEDYNKVSNVMTEYGHLCKNLSASLSYLEEHYTPLIAGNALNALSAS